MSESAVAPSACISQESCTCHFDIPHNGYRSFAINTWISKEEHCPQYSTELQFIVIEQLSTKKLLISSFGSKPHTIRVELVLISLRPITVKAPAQTWERVLWAQWPREVVQKQVGSSPSLPAANETCPWSQETVPLYVMQNVAKHLSCHQQCSEAMTGSNNGQHPFQSIVVL